MAKDMYDFMQLALDEARLALAQGEVPVGCVLVKDGVVIQKAHNTSCSSTHLHGHAEFNAICKAADRLGSYGLKDSEVYVTLEPCAMCMGLIILERISKVVFGAYDFEWGACGSFVRVQKKSDTPEVYGGIMEQQCRELLRTFFHSLRSTQN